MRETGPDIARDVFVIIVVVVVNANWVMECVRECDCAKLLLLLLLLMLLLLLELLLLLRLLSALSKKRHPLLSSPQVCPPLSVAEGAREAHESYVQTPE